MKSIMERDTLDFESVYANPLNNTAFTQLMEVDDEKGNVAALSLLNCIVPDFEHDPIRSLKAAPVDQEIRDSDDDSRSLRMDFHAVTDRLEHVVVEMQFKRHILFDERALAHAAAAFFQQLQETRSFQKGSWFKSLRKTYAIQFLNYDSNKIIGIKDPFVKDLMVERVQKHPMKDGDFMKWYVFTDKFSGQEIDHLQLLQIELPRAESLGLFPLSRDFDEKRWWMSLFNHAREYTPEIVEQLYKEGIMPQGIYDGLKRMEIKRWNPTLQKKYKMDTAIVEIIQHFYYDTQNVLYPQKRTQF
jgi:hypothetical protein